MNIKNIKSRLRFVSIIALLAISSIALSVPSDANELALESRNREVLRESFNNEFGGSEYDAFMSATSTNDGGFVAVGGSSSTDAEFVNEGKMDAIIAKYGSKGAQQWAKSFGGSDNDTFASVATTNDGGFVAVGKSDSTNAGFVNAGGIDAIIVKYDSGGTQQWVKSFGGSNDDLFVSATSTSDGGFIAVGFSDSTNAGFVNAGGIDAIIVKYDSGGTHQWVKSFGGSNDDAFVSVASASDGGFIAVGRSDSIDAGFTNVGMMGSIIVKYDSAGTQQWVKSFGGSGGDIFTFVTSTNDGGFIAVGSSNSTDAGFVNVGREDAIIVKYDRDGTQQWVKSFGGSGEDAFMSATVTRDGNLLVAGYGDSSDAEYENSLGILGSFIVCFNSDGEMKFIKDFRIGIMSMPVNILMDVHDKVVVVGQKISLAMESRAFISGYNYVDLEKEAVEIAESTLNTSDIETARDLVNQLPESSKKDQLQDRLNAISPNISMDKKNATANLDIYIKSENMLSLSLDTNSVSFDDFSGVEDVEKQNAVNLTVSSSLPYTVKAYLASEIQNVDKSKIMDKSILNIKANSEPTYKTFSDIVTPIVLLDNQIEGNNINHGIYLKLKGNIAHEKDVYKTTIKFEVEQK